MRPTVLLDATPMLDTSGHRGIGRFLYDLLHGLAATAREWEGDFALRVVTDLDLHGGGVVDDDPATAAESTRAARGTRIDRIAWRRRVSLGRLARTATVLHLPEPRGTPLRAHPRTVVTCHDLIPLRFPRQYLGKTPWAAWVRRGVERRRLARAAKVVAISRKTMADAIELLGLPAERFVVVPNGIDLSTWSPIAPPGEAAALRARGVGARPFVVYVGYCDHRKAIDAMFATLSRLRGRLDLDLVWAGALLDDDLVRLRADTARHGLEGRVHLLGFVDDATLAALYRGAVAHLFLSRLEGFGLSVAEALASGCPAIVVAGSGADEVAGDAGLVVAADDADAAAAALVALAGDPSARARRVAAGLARARTFGRETMARGYADVWRRVVAGS